MKKYYETALNKLNAKQVVKELGDNVVLLCYEKPGEFCHRQIVAKWLENQIGDLIVNEIK